MFEDREIKTGEIPAGGKWMKIFVMREDTNDGILKMSISAGNHKDLEIDKLVIIPD